MITSLNQFCQNTYWLMVPMHIGPTRGHIRKVTVLKNRGIGLKIAAIGIRWPCQSLSFEKLPHFYVKNIFLAQKLMKWEGFYKSIRKSLKIQCALCTSGATENGNQEQIKAEPKLDKNLKINSEPPLCVICLIFCIFAVVE